MTIRKIDSNAFCSGEKKHFKLAKVIFLFIFYIQSLLLIFSTVTVIFSQICASIKSELERIIWRKNADQFHQNCVIKNLRKWLSGPHLLQKRTKTPIFELNFLILKLKRGRPNTIGWPHAERGPWFCRPLF
jgi:hypothetical protein